MTFKFQLYSDIHCEFLTNKRLKKIFPYQKKEDYLILAGDIGIFKYKNFEILLDHVNKIWKKIFFVLGNHEYYTNLDYLETNQKYHEIFDKYENIILLDKNAYELDDYILVGCCLWAPFDKIKLNKDNFPIFHEVYSKKKPISIEEYNLIHENEKKWLINTLEKKTNKKKIVITHYPIITDDKLCPKQFRNYKSNTFFMNVGIDYEKYDDVALYISGHTHCCHDFEINGKRFISNQKGYFDEDYDIKNFKNDGVFQI